MSRNQEIKFVKYWEENVKEEYKNERHIFLLMIGGLKDYQKI